MKKLLMLLSIAVSITFTSCSKYDDSEIWKVLNKYGERISALEELCKQMNTNITNLQTIVKALQENDYITNVVPIRKDGEIIGYTITFSQSDTITIYNGEDGNDGHTPQISIMAIDGIYYWMLDGEYVLDADGNKLKAEGTDGLTPKFKIENDYWKISYDGEKTWTQLGKAIGENGLYNSDGEMVFKDLSIKDGYVVLTLNDGKNSQMRIPFSSGELMVVHIDSAGTLENLLTPEQQRNVVTLKLTGKYNDDDIMFIYYYLNSLETLDLSEAISMYSFSISSIYNDYLGVFDSPNRTIRHIILGSTLNGEDVSGCVATLRNLSVLQTVTITKNNSWLYSTSEKTEYYLGNCPNFLKIIVAEGVTQLRLINNYKEYLTYNMAKTLDLPSTLEKISNNAFYTKALYTVCRQVICRSLMPPKIFDQTTQVGSFATTNVSYITLYVPKESVEIYKIAAGWCDFKEILPLEEYKE